MAKKLPPGMVQKKLVYYAQFRANGRYVRKRLSTDFKAACTLLNELRSRADKADFGLLDNDYSWDDLKREYLAWVRQSISHPGEYERDLKHFELYSKIHKVREITHSYVVGYRSWRLSQGSMKNRDDSKPAKPITPRTVNKEVGTLRAMLNKAVEWNRIGSNPIAGIKPLKHESITKNRRSLTLEEVEKLFQASSDRFRPVMRMFLTTGIRHFELVKMKFSDVDFERRIVTVRGKGGKVREIPLDDGMLDTIKRLQREAATREPVVGFTNRHTERQAANFSREHVFVTKANTPWRNNLLKRFYALCEKVGIEDAQPGGSIDIHSLRVSYTTLSLEHGANPKAIQSILGHSTLSLTMSVYAKATEKAKRDAVSVLPFAQVSAPDHIISLNAGQELVSSQNPATQTIPVSDVKKMTS